MPTAAPLDYHAQQYPHEHVIRILKIDYSSCQNTQEQCLYWRKGPKSGYELIASIPYEEGQLDRMTRIANICVEVLNQCDKTKRKEYELTIRHAVDYWTIYRNDGYLKIFLEQYAPSHADELGQSTMVADSRMATDRS